MNKRGLSPVVATTLLILVAVIIAVAIFWWVKQFIAESVQKDVGGGEQAIDTFCKDLSFTADVSAGGVVTLQNNGQIPIYGVDVKKKGFASVESIGVASSKYYGVQGGNTEDLGNEGFSETLTSGDNVLLVPIMLGQGETEQKTYVCDKDFGIEVRVA